ncbi:MAG: DNA-processing protein DprA [Gemmatimonadota bacterium]
MSVAPLDRNELAARMGLLATPGLKPNRVLRLLLDHGSGAEVYRALPDVCGPELAAAARSDEIRTRVRRALATVIDNGIHVIPHGDPRYPTAVSERLAEFAPPLLFARGRVELLAGTAIAVGVVGSRRATEYGLDIAAEIGGGVARAGGCVVSGVALGIDAAAHAAALDAAGASIGVLGCGVDVYYPRQNTQLQDRLAQDGVLISELLPGEPPLKQHFPERNRIIAALCHTVVVVEAAAQSGALTTAGHAATLGAEVLGVMNAMHLPNMQGLLTLFREGVKPYTGVRDLLEEVRLIGFGEALPPELEDEESAEPPVAPLHAKVWAALNTRARTPDHIAAETGLPVQQVLGVLLDLELDGRVRQVERGRGFARVRRTARKRAEAGLAAQSVLL